ncbi:uncharacterized protein MEPE_02226 [Melanopsichium pennsylvanicum]|uniref:Uncharacterized protein n=1 Tax=Melanopsichium pennsylvanicum TaxID=63383 RepID=A0AAJ5C4I0_9BASI|nr:uncharacterized protein MEPE_02226 [Melanopsichium pennsylvanicum]
MVAMYAVLPLYEKIKKLMVLEGSPYFLAAYVCSDRIDLVLKHLRGLTKEESVRDCISVAS